MRVTLGALLALILVAPLFSASPADARLRRGASVPDYMQLSFLMTDGTVLAQSGSNSSNWWRYTPDNMGNYANGTWAQVGSMQSGYDPSAGSTAVLADGRLVFMGGEYNPPSPYDLQLTNLGAIFDPLKNTWTPLKHPKGWSEIGDSPNVVLPTGQFFVGQKLTQKGGILDPKTLQWSAAGMSGKSDWNSEEGWVLLADGSILTEDVLNAPNSERYIPSQGTWVTAGSTGVDLHSPSPYTQCLQWGPKPKQCYLPPGEIGPAMMLPNGDVFATGSGSGPDGSGPGHTSTYHSMGSKAGTWTVGPDFPNNDDAGDEFAAALPNGHVLVYGVSGEMYEYDGTKLNIVGPWQGAPLLLPTGQVMILGNSITFYTASGSPNPAWAPAISKSPKSVKSGKTYQIFGTQFNGLSMGMAFGDEYQTATNFPLVRITNNSSKHVFYARTHDHSTMGVQTGSTTVYTFFDVPTTIDKGASTVQVIANGIASQAVSITVK